MSWMNAACKAAAVGLPDKALRPGGLKVEGCRHTQVTRCPLNAGAWMHRMRSSQRLRVGPELEGQAC